MKNIAPNEIRIFDDWYPWYVFETISTVNSSDHEAIELNVKRILNIGRIIIVVRDKKTQNTIQFITKCYLAHNCDIFNSKLSNINTRQNTRNILGECVILKLFLFGSCKSDDKYHRSCGECDIQIFFIDYSNLHQL